MSEKPHSVKSLQLPPQTRLAFQKEGDRPNAHNETEII